MASQVGVGILLGWPGLKAPGGHPQQEHQPQGDGHRHVVLEDVGNVGAQCGADFLKHTEELWLDGCWEGLGNDRCFVSHQACYTLVGDRGTDSLGSAKFHKPTTREGFAPGKRKKPSLAAP